RPALSQPVIVENISGANGSIPVGRIARTPADGYTISIGDWTTHVLNGALYNLSYESSEGFCACYSPRQKSLSDHYQEGGAGNRPQWFHCMVESEPRCVGGGHRRREPSACRWSVLSERCRYQPTI